MIEKIKKIYSKNSKFYHYFLLVLIILTGAFLRFYNLDTNPIALNQDEAINGYDAFSIANTGRDQHGAWQPQPMLESFGDWTSPLITFITIPFVKIFGLNVWSVRLPVALLGVGSILLFYILVNQLFKNKNYALLGAFIWALSPWNISITRWAIPPSIVPFFLLLFLVLLFDALNSKNFGFRTIRKYIFVGLSAGVLTYAYPTMKLFVPLFVGFICLIFLIWFRKKFRELFIAGLVCLLTIAPIFVLTFLDPNKYNARYSATSLSGTGENLVLGFFMRYLEYFTPTFAFGFGDPDTMHKVQGFASVPDFLSLFFYIGLFVVIYKLVKFKENYTIEKTRLYILLGGLALFPIAAALTKDHFMLLRTIHGFVFITLFILLGIKFILESVANLKVKQLIIAVISGLLIFNAIAFSVFYFVYYPATVKSSFNYGLKETFDFVDKNEAFYNKVIIDKDILQVYYLFYKNYDPNFLHSKPSGEKFNVYENSKVEFKEIRSCNLQGAYKMFTVEDDKHVWYSVFAKDDTLYVVKVLQYQEARFQF